MSFTIFHNPRCSKSRNTLNLLKENGIEPDIRLYVIDPPSSDEIQDIIDKLHIRPKDLLRKGESVFKELNLNQQEDRTDVIIQIMSENPILIERPIVIRGEKAIIGRPPENVLSLIGALENKQSILI